MDAAVDLKAIDPFHPGTEVAFKPAFRKFCETWFTKFENARAYSWRVPEPRVFKGFARAFTGLAALQAEPNPFYEIADPQHPVNKEM